MPCSHISALMEWPLNDLVKPKTDRLACQETPTFPCRRLTGAPGSHTMHRNGLKLAHRRLMIRDCVQIMTFEHVREELLDNKSWKLGMLWMHIVSRLFRVSVFTVFSQTASCFVEYFQFLPIYEYGLHSNEKQVLRGKTLSHNSSCVSLSISLIQFFNWNFWYHFWIHIKLLAWISHYFISTPK